MLVRLALAPKAVEVEGEEVAEDVAVGDLVVEDEIEGGAPGKRSTT